MTKPKAGTLPPSETKPEFEQSVRELEAKVKADAARAAMEAMAGESGELPGGVQGSVGEDGVMRFGGAGSPKGARQSYLADEYDPDMGTLVSNLRSNALLGDMAGSTEVSPAARAFSSLGKGAKQAAIDARTNSGLLQAKNREHLTQEKYDRLQSYYDKTGDFTPREWGGGTAAEYVGALIGIPGQDQEDVYWNSRQPEYNNPYAGLWKSKGGDTQGYYTYYIDASTGEPKYIDFASPLAQNENQKKAQDANLRLVSKYAEEREGELSEADLEALRQILQGHTQATANPE